LRETFDAMLPASTNGQRQRRSASAGRRKNEEKPMKSRFFHCSAVASMLAAMAFAPTAALSKYVCDNPSSMVDKRACAKAAEGPDALRNFVTRTRMIWQLDIWDYVRPEPSASTSAAAKPAREAEVLSKQTAITTN
jgi:hypothetical protein